MKKYKIKRPLLPPTQSALTISYNGNTKYDWPAIKNDYITGYENEDGVRIYPTTKELSERHPDVPYGQIRNRASRENWETFKQKSMRDATVERHKMMLKKLNQGAIAFDEKTAEDAEFAKAMIRRQMENLAKAIFVDEARVAEVFRQLEEGEIEVLDIKQEWIKPWASPSAMESLAKAYALFVEVGRKAYGIKDDEPAITQKVNIDITNTTNVTQQIRKVDPRRLADLKRIMSNPNMILPGQNIVKQDIIDGELVEDEMEAITDGSVQAEEENR